MKIKWDDLIAAFAVGVIIGFLLGNSFSSPSSEASPVPYGMGSGFISSGSLMDRISDFQSEGQGSTPCRSSFTEMRVTAYCPCDRCCGKWSDGVTASGHVIKEDDKFVAASPSFPFGTILDIPDYGKVPVLDRGGAIKGNRLDVFFHTHQEALNWGVKYLKVEVEK